MKKSTRTFSCRLFLKKNNLLYPLLPDAYPSLRVDILHFVNQKNLLFIRDTSKLLL
jgi:hypothetical protein